MPERRGVIAEFTHDRAIVAAAATLVERGYRELDAFVPRPIVALEELIAPVRSTLPRTVFIGAVIGGATALAIQWFCNAWHFPLNVGGRPPFALPAFIPITFELLVLFGSLTAFFGVLWRMGLPRLTDPVFEVPGFESASIDRFWLYVALRDPHFRAGELEQLLTEHGAVSLSWTGHELTPEPGGSVAPPPRPEEATP